jgi:murein DD-endopeptidase MepM/ murein hydrolase activator NlpD
MVAKVKNRITIGAILTILLLSASVFILGFKLTTNRTPKEVYVVYVDGQKIGTVKSAKEFEDYINYQEEKLKEKYNVSKIHTPKGVEIKKEITYKDNYDSYDTIYNMLVKKQNFTIKGVIVTIEKEEEVKEEKEEEPKKEKIIINVTSKDIFDESVIDLVKSFLDEKEYNAFMESNQEPIVDTGELIESIYIKENITYKEGYISTDEEIFTDTGELTKYLLYGTTKEQNTYTVKAGDTIESIANANKLNTKEFLIANPEFTSVNNLLYESQKVVVGLINPIISIVVEKHSVKDEVAKFQTETKYDSDLVLGYYYTEREGENGMDRVTRKYQYINGQLVDVAMVGSVEIKPAVSKVVVRGSRYVPDVADISNWAWPTQKPYTITTWYEWRWGTFHHAIDIYVGFGSPIYAANNGKVVSVKGGCIRGYTGCNGGGGNYVIINHNILGYHTQYMHLNTIDVVEGQTVERGQKIGTMGNTGSVFPTPAPGSNSFAGTHLDFSAWHGMPYNGGTPFNPMELY